MMVTRRGKASATAQAPSGVGASETPKEGPVLGPIYFWLPTSGRLSGRLEMAVEEKASRNCGEIQHCS
jgi:hypothetical protein